MSSLKNGIRGKAFWGPRIWSTIHILALNVSENNMNYYEKFLDLLVCLLPCETCCKNLRMKLEKIPPKKYLENNDAFLYTYILHDYVNKSIVPPKETPEYDNIKAYYTSKAKSYSLYEEYMWFTIHALAITLKPENALKYKEFLYIISYLLPLQESQHFQKGLSIFLPDPYLGNNFNAFFYTYLLRDYINEISGKSSSDFDKLKAYFHRGLSKECKDCNV